MKRLLLGTAMALAVIVGASAADLRPVPVYSKAPPPFMSWTGCYIGGNIGGGWSSSSYADGVLGFSDGGANGAGVVGGGQIGCDYQVGAFVFGVQGMFDGTSIQATGSNVLAGLNNNDFVPWLATATGRIGYTVMPTTLLYVKGGAAWVHDTVTGINAVTLVPATGATYTPTGWTVGGGIEHMFAPHWSVFVEYDYMGFGNRAVNFTALPVPATGATFPVTASQNVQMAIVGVNFKFWY
jgi:outer membrane immunogenic protein